MVVVVEEFYYETLHLLQLLQPSVDMLQIGSDVADPGADDPVDDDVDDVDGKQDGDDGRWSQGWQ